MVEEILNNALEVKNLMDDLFKQINAHSHYEHLTDPDEPQEQWEADRDTLEAQLPSSWLDDKGTRHAVIYDEGEEWRIRLVNGEAVIEPPF